MVSLIAMLKGVSLWNQWDISHSGIVCDITPLQYFFFDITPVLIKAYVACSTLSCGVFMCDRYQLIKIFERSYLLFLPNSMPFIINSIILRLQLDRDISNYMNSMASTQNNLRLVCCVEISLCLGWRRITWAFWAQEILCNPKLSDIATQHTKPWQFCYSSYDI